MVLVGFDRGLSSLSLYESLPKKKEESILKKEEKGRAVQLNLEKLNGELGAKKSSTFQVCSAVTNGVDS